MEEISQHYGNDTRFSIMQNLDGIGQPYTCEMWADFGGIESYNLIDDGTGYFIYNLFSLNANWHTIAIFDQNMVFRYFTSDTAGYIIENMLDPLLAESTWILGDINNDSIIDILDIIVMVRHIMDQNNYNYILDINQDQIININDVILIINIVIEE